VIEKINMDNDRFSAYYKAQKIVPEEEWDTFIDALRQHLPTTFRVAGSRQYVLHIPSQSITVYRLSEQPIS
jgi:multisite-specific tRNA:(cytosine-C5)-methyltransferase